MPKKNLEIDERIDEALALQRVGNLDGAEVIYRDILNIHPAHAETLHFLGLIAHQRGENAQAIDLLKQTIVHDPENIQFQFNLGLIQTNAELYNEAVNTFENLKSYIPTDPNMANTYASALKGAEKWHAAEKVLLDLVKSHPDFVPGLFNLGNLYLLQGHATQAIKRFKDAVKLEPSDAIVRNLATALQIAGKREQAIALLEELIETSPSDTAALNNLGNLYRETGGLKKASILLDRALRIAPELADAWFNLGAIQVSQNDLDKGTQSFKRALHIRPQFTKADWAAKLALPQIYESEEHRQTMRARWQNGLAEIKDATSLKTYRDIQTALEAISEVTPFALAYQGEDDRELMSTWGNLVSSITQSAYPEFSAPATTHSSERKRIAFVSAHFRSHTIERLFSTWLTGLDPAEFEVHLVSTSGGGDYRTKELETVLNGSYTHSTSTKEIASYLHQLAADVIIYPDIGMDPRTQVLASLRFARQQAMAWGHPVTSGLPTIDTFLSSTLMEPAESQAHYNEDLVLLPNLSINYSRPDKPIDEIPHDYLCAQSLFKIPPHQDQAFAKILQTDSGRVLSFFAHPIPEVTAAFESRISNAFRHVGLDPDEALRFIAPCDRNTFLRHLSGARVILDTFEWSGGNTSLEAFAMGTPVVTLPGQFMRGRHTAAMIDLMNIDELKVNSINSYIALSERLGIDQPFFTEIKTKIEREAPKLFGDRSPIDGLASFLRAQ